MESSQASRPTPGFVSAYRKVAVWSLNLSLIFVALNVALELAFRAMAEDETRAAANSSMRAWLETQAELHPGMTGAEIMRLDHETWSRPFEYEALTQFREAPFAGDFVNVSDHGFRASHGEAPWPPPDEAHVVFLFGGSTTFGYGVHDRETIASHLEQVLGEASAEDVLVYNFGRGNYFSSQERALFEALLVAGQVPDVAVFIDGFNDFRLTGGPLFTGELARSFDHGGAPAGAAPLAWLPVARFARRMGRRFGGENGGVPARAVGLCPAEEARPEATIARLRANWRVVQAVGEAWGVEVLCVLQPVPYFEYDLEQHHFARHLPKFAGVGVTYEALAKQRAEGLELGDSVLWLADMQRELKEPLYVDVAHYSGAMSRRIAERIGAALAVGSEGGTDR